MGNLPCDELLNEHPRSIPTIRQVEIRRLRHRRRERWETAQFRVRVDRNLIGDVFSGLGTTSSFSRHAWEQKPPLTTQREHSADRHPTR